jgi:phosphomannomutase
MRDYVGGEWRRLHVILHALQGDVMEVMPELPLTGQFISYRGSMLNWCPIGREAGAIDRATFEEIDNHRGIRAGLLVTLRDRLSIISKKLTVKLGGSTSFDIYPAGWDKSYVIGRFKDEKVWFVGDRCGPTGNDYEIYEALRPLGQSFKVEGPSNTPEAIYEIMLMMGVLCDEMRSPPY